MPDASQMASDEATKVQWIVHRKDEMLKDLEKNKKFVRSHAMKEFRAKTKPARSSKSKPVSVGKRIVEDGYNDQTDTNKSATPDEIDGSLRRTYANPSTSTDVLSLLPYKSDTSWLHPAIRSSDPFDSLPARSGPALRGIVQFYFAAIPDLIPNLDTARQGTYFHRSRNMLWRAATADQISFYGFLHTTGFVRDSATGGGEVSTAVLKFKDKCIGLLRAQLDSQKKRTDISSIIGIGMLLASSCMMGDFVQARLHLNAIRQVLKERGGLSTIDYEIQVILAWGAAHLYAAEHSFPDEDIRLPFDPSSLPPGLMKLARSRADQSLKAAPPCEHQSFHQMVLSLHIIALVSDSEWAVHLARDDSINSVVTAEYDVLTFNADQRRVLPEGPLDHEHKMLVIVGISSQIFAFLVHEHVSLSRGTGGVFLVHLQAALNENDDCYTWASVFYPRMMAWILYVAVEAHMLSKTGADFFLQRLRHVLDLQNVLSFRDFQQTLVSFPLTSDVGAAKSFKIWSHTRSVQPWHQSQTKIPIRLPPLLGWRAAGEHSTTSNVA